MTISANRVHYLWSPLLGWALLTCSASIALAQVGVAVPGVSDTTVTPPPSPADQPTTSNEGASSSPNATGGATPAIVLPPLNAGVPVIQLPPGTTAANPSTQIIPGVSDVFAGTVGSNVVGSGGGDGAADDGLGIQMGSFRLYPQIDIITGYDTNVFATNNVSNGSTTSSTTTTAPVTSLSTIISPQLALRSDWLNHSLNVLLGGGFGFYASAPTQNYQNYFLVVNGRVDVREDTSVLYSFGYRRATEALGTPNVAFAQAPTVDESIPLSLALTKRFNRVTVEVGGSATRFWFTDYSTITSIGLDAASRNYNAYEEHVRFGYELSDSLTLYVTPSIAQSRYDLTTDSAGQNRNSDTTNLGFGANWSINATSSLQGNVGYSMANSGGLGSTSAYTFGLSGSWNGYQPLTLRPSLTRGITETALAAYRNTVTTVAGFDYNYQFGPEWALAGGFSYSLTDYQPIDGLGASPREDTFGRASIGLLWTPRPDFSIGPIFEYTQGSSSDSTGPSYNRQILSIRLSARR